MKDYRPRPRIQIGWFLAILAAITTTPVMAQTANFGRFSLLPGFEPAQGKFSGYTNGSYSLSAISNRDRNKQACIGFADPKPDYIMVLEKDFEQMRILIDTGNSDTTLLVKGPDDNMIRCGDDTGKSKDASVSDRNWKKGIYHIWVGTFNPNVKRKYTLTVQQQ
ncbi:hypothetical protein IQ259_17390 [Fortiea sp. LEGE XX443]|uniref:hypothetical protein n=1 Tax=Fortiea sp. LEGE XX443 TaxID=1828611 RepID=UPI00187EC7D9|nr:hypothetical protein [Fortiea sp. LEGE XX443]MBE9006791.1 hypothetical protein [Fortiea sp. LEGE XX443]